MRRPRRRPATSAGSRPTTARPDEAFLKAVFAAEAEHADRRHRGRATASSGSAASTEIAPDDGRRRLPGQARRTTASTSPSTATVVARRRHPREARGQDRRRRRPSPGPQRAVAEIYISERRRPTSPSDAIKVRHILYSPEGRSRQGASTVPGRRSGVGDGEGGGRARRTPSSRPIPSLFDAIARAESDEARPRAPTGTGGKLPYFDSGQQRSTRRSWRPITAARPQGRRDPRAGQVRLRLARHPGHVPPDRQRPAGRRSRPRPTAATTSRDPRARQLRGPDGGRRRRPRLGRQGPARRAADRRDLRGRRSARRREVVDVADDGLYLFKVLARGDADARGPPARGAQADGVLATGTTRRRTRSSSPATRPSRRRAS